MPIPPEEHRKFPRVDYKVPVRYQLRGTRVHSTTLTDNISEGGIRFTNYGFIAPNTYLNLEMGVLMRFFNSIGKVAWAQQVPHTNQYHIGIAFEELEYNTKVYLSDFIQLHSGNL